MSLVSQLLAIGVPDLAALYWASLIVGGGLLLLSAISGGEDGSGIDADADLSLDVDVDVDADVDADFDTGHVGAGSLASWLSVRFLVFFAVVFGLVGVAMTHFADQSRGVVLAASLGGGLAVGQMVHHLFRSLRRTSGNSAPSEADYVNQQARVTIPLTAEQKGEVALRVGRAKRFIPAIARNTDTAFQAGDRVVVVGYSGGIGEVVSREEYEFLNEQC